MTVHTATSFEDHSRLLRINKIYGDIRTFFSRFKGVSTRWLRPYFGWYKWLHCFNKNPDTTANHIVHGDYDNT